MKILFEIDKSLESAIKADFDNIDDAECWNECWNYSRDQSVIFITDLSNKCSASYNRTTKKLTTCLSGFTYTDLDDGLILYEGALNGAFSQNLAPRWYNHEVHILCASGSYGKFFGANALDYYIRTRSRLEAYDDKLRHQNRRESLACEMLTPQQLLRLTA